MVDYFALALTHGLLALAAWRLLLRPELDRSEADCFESDRDSSDSSGPDREPGESEPSAPGGKTAPHA